MDNSFNRVQVDAQGEMLDLKMAVYSMVNRLFTLADEITRPSLQVGTEGIRKVCNVNHTFPRGYHADRVYRC